MAPSNVANEQCSIPSHSQVLLSFLNLQVRRGIPGAKSIPRRNVEQNSLRSLLQHEEATILPTADLASDSKSSCDAVVLTSYTRSIGSLWKTLKFVE